MNTLEILQKLLPQYEASQDNAGFGSPFNIIDNKRQLGVAIILRGIPLARLPSIAKHIELAFKEYREND
jgi:hypothetical protein